MHLFFNAITKICHITYVWLSKIVQKYTIFSINSRLHEGFFGVFFQKIRGGGKLIDNQFVINTTNRSGITFHKTAKNKFCGAKHPNPIGNPISPRRIEWGSRLGNMVAD